MSLQPISLADLFIIMSLGFALVPAGLCYLARWWLDRGRIEPPWMIPLIMVLGGAGGLAFAYYGYDLVVEFYAWLFGRDVPSEPLLYEALLVPTAEELGKLVVLLPFVFTRWFRGPVDGIVYGLAAGAGFACVENFAYFATAFEFGGQENWIAEVSVRAIPSAAIHGCASAAFGAFLGAARFNPRRVVTVAAPLVGFIGALLIHGGWNATVSLASIAPETAITGVLTLLTLCCVGLVLALIAAVRVESEALARELSAEVRAGHLGPRELSAVVHWRERRRRGWLADGARRARLIGTAMDLGLTLHHHRRTGRHGPRIERLRAEMSGSRGMAADPGLEPMKPDA